MSTKVRVTTDPYLEQPSHDVFEGDLEIGLGPDGTLLVQSMIPDVDNTNEGRPKSKLVAIYAKDGWFKAEYV